MFFFWYFYIYTFQSQRSLFSRIIFQYLRIFVDIVACNSLFCSLVLHKFQLVLQSKRDRPVRRFMVCDGEIKQHQANKDGVWQKLNRTFQRDNYSYLDNYVFHISRRFPTIFPIKQELIKKWYSLVLLFFSGQFEATKHPKAVLLLLRQQDHFLFHNPGWYLNDLGVKSSQAI